MTESNSDWLTVAQASARLNLSDKTIRKRISAGAIPAEKIALDNGGSAWRIPLEWVNQQEGSKTEELSGTEAKQNENGSSDQPIQIETEVRPIVETEDSGRDGSETEREKEVLWPTLIEEKDARIADLRAQIEQQRLQIEAANRTAAEAQAALREVLKMSNRALIESTSAGAQEDAQPGQSALESQPSQAELLQQIETLKANQESLRQETEWMAKQMQTLPSPQKRGWFARWFGSD